ncbi:MAG: hypothetical protein U1G07_16390 [Verrucomicrobiota bacterium]
MNRRRLPLQPLALSASLLATALSAQAQFAINIGTVQVQPNQANQQIFIDVSNVSSAGALDFYVQIADGFPDVPGSTQNGPNITAVDIVTGTLFDGNNDGGQVGSGLGLQHQYRGVLTQTGTVSGSGRLATVTIDTTGFNSGSWALRVGTVHNGPTQFYDTNFDPLPGNITDGTLAIVPEPAAYAMAMGILAFGFVSVRRCCRRTA